MTAQGAEPSADPGSFRDPSGRVFHWRGQVFRVISRAAAGHYEFARDSGILADLVGRGLLLAASECAPGAPPEPPPGIAEPAYVVEHPRLPFISHPYEWPFRALRRAAELHLDLHLELLGRGANLSDATAYNIQFQGPRPVFIDLLSIRQYVAGEFWLGHRQFCEQFLNPLLLESMTGVTFNEWFRGRMEGIPAADLARLLPWRRRWRPRMLTHVFLPAAAQARTARSAVNTAGRRFPKSALVGMLRGLRNWVSRLEPASPDDTTWSDYAERNSYDTPQNARKHELVARFVTAARPRAMFDVGCNTGAFAATALRSGAQLVVGLDADHGALEGAFARAEQESLAFLPLYVDLANPSPGQGWNERERRGLAERAPLDAVLALAIVHHLAIGRNVPLGAIAAWLASLAPRVLVEFVPKTDPMVRLMLRNRADVFPDYTLDAFRGELARVGRIVHEAPLAEGGRVLLEVTCGACPQDRTAGPVTDRPAR